MTIRAKFSLGCAALLLLSACDGSDAPANQNRAVEALDIARDQPPEVRDAEARTCLDVIWAALAEEGETVEAAEKQFDRENDEVEGGRISCATATSPSQFEAVLRDLREAATNGDRATTLAQAGIPLLFIDSAGQRRELADSASLEAAFDEIFSERTLARMRTLDLDQLTVVPEKGAFFDLGAIWLVVPETAARPKLVTLNAQSAAELEAIATAEDSASETR